MIPDSGPPAHRWYGPSPDQGRGRACAACRRRQYSLKIRWISSRFWVFARASIKRMRDFTGV